MHEWRARQFFPKDEEKIRPRCVNQLTIGILGYGNMGKSIAKLFKVSLIFLSCSWHVNNQFWLLNLPFFSPFHLLFLWSFSIEIEMDKTKKGLLAICDVNSVLVVEEILWLIYRILNITRKTNPKIFTIFSAIRLFFRQKNNNKLTNMSS